ncbi:GNAT family N-acetyltransferase [uncultured Clostridium sp.]|uniref:GNAT family N-acetyltransferase n=1 Tax=uncultured Clostridium sp. TaxID=59620 RepID=UPI0025E0EF41|nr:GNAT family N-acetyltransferase [uncultured Clostridium sp.]
MVLISDRIIIRYFERKDKEDLYRIVWQKDVVRFMRDWSEYNPTLENINSYIDWRQSQKDSKDIYENKRYAVALRDSNKLIGMVGMGIEETLNEVEVAYFIDEKYKGHGYATEAVKKIVDWCFKVSDIPYLIATIDCANKSSCRVLDKSGFELFEKRTPISHKQPNMESDSYYYYRIYRKQDIY